jgi:hypothetical protein
MGDFGEKRHDEVQVGMVHAIYDKGNYFTTNECDEDVSEIRDEHSGKRGSIEPRHKRRDCGYGTIPLYQKTKAQGFGDYI